MKDTVPYPGRSVRKGQKSAEAVVVGGVTTTQGG